MPPFSKPPSPFSPFEPQKPLGPTLEVPQSGGMDQQTKNTLMFAIIFSVLAAGVLLFIFLKPEKEPESAETSIATGAATSATTTPRKSGFFSFFNFNLSDLSQKTPVTVTPSPSRTRGATTSRTTSTRTSNTTDSTGTSGATSTATSTTVNVPTKQLIGVYSELSSAQAQLDLEFYKMDLPSSPARGKVWISSVHKSTDPKQEYLTLSTGKDLSPSTNITGMTIKSVVSGSITQIGKGAPLPITNSVNTPSDIYIESGQKIVISTGASPLGYSFRLNDCTGYFEQYQNFSPALPQVCPLLKDVPLPAPPNQLQDPCLDYIDRFPKCQIITALPKATADALNLEQQNRCLAFIQNNTGYQNCSNAHRNEPGFYASEWRVYLDRTQTLWKSKREVIWLLDQQGNFVSQYSY